MKKAVQRLVLFAIFGFGFVPVFAALLAWAQDEPDPWAFWKEEVWR